MKDDVVTKLEWVIKAEIVHTKNADTVSIHSETIGKTTQEGMRKLSLEIVNHVCQTYGNNRKDLYFKAEKDVD